MPEETPKPLLQAPLGDDGVARAYAPPGSDRGSSSSTNSSTNSTSGPPSDRANDIALAARNTLKLGASLIATWSVAIAVRIPLPRYLGPERFGALNFSDNVAGAFFTFLELGIDTYIIRECAVRPKHANDFFGTMLAARLAGGLALFAAMATAFHVFHRTPEEQVVVVVFGAAYFVQTMNNSLAALLQARGTVGRLAISNVGSKVVWGLGLAVAIGMKGSLPFIAAPLLVSELLKTMVLLPIARAAVGLRFALHVQRAKAVFIASRPFLVNTLAINLGPKLNVSILGFIANDKEVGFFGATTNLGSLALLLSPLMMAVLMPLLARAKARSMDEAFKMMQRMNEGLVVTIIPVTLMISLGAPLLVRLAFGAKFAAAATSLAAFSPSFVLMYVAMSLSILLMTLNRSWTVTLISAGAIPVRAVLVVALVPIFSRLLGDGGGATGAAVAEALTNLYAVVASGIALGSRAVDRRAVVALGKSLGCAAAIAFLHTALARLGDARLAVDIVAYVALALAIRVVRVSDIVGAINVIRTRKQA